MFRFLVYLRAQIIHENVCSNLLEDIVFDERDIIEAISSLTPNAAPGPDGFPAVILKNY